MSAALLFSLVHLLYVLSGDESKIKRLEFKRHSAALCLEERWKTDRKKERKRSYRVCTFSPALYLWAMYTAESHDPKVHYMIWITMNFWLRWSICDCKHVCVCVCVSFEGGQDCMWYKILVGAESRKIECWMVTMTHCPLRRTNMYMLHAHTEANKGRGEGVGRHEVTTNKEHD